MIVAVLGSLMRFKIAFEFPFFVQKNLLHSHSHFALFGWISFILMILMANNLGDTIFEIVTKKFRIIFIGFLICVYGMLISFALQGYGLFSIFFSTLSIPCHLHLVDYIIKQPGVSKIQLVENGF